MSDCIYKIRQKSTGLYSTGGQYPNWTKQGKVWRALGHLRNHIALINERRSAAYHRWSKASVYEDAEVVRLALTIVGVEDVDTMLARHRANKAEKDRKRDEKDRQRKADQAIKDAREQERREREQLAKLQEKYPSV